MAVSSVAPRYGRPRRPQNRALIELFSSNADTNVSQSITGLPSAAARKGKCMSASPVLQVTCCCALAQLFCTSRVAPLCIDLRVTFCCALTCSACPCCCALTCSACHVLPRCALTLFITSRVAMLCTALVLHVTCCRAVQCPRAGYPAHLQARLSSSASNVVSAHRNQSSQSQRTCSFASFFLSKV